MNVEHRTKHKPEGGAALKQEADESLSFNIPGPEDRPEVLVKDNEADRGIRSAS